jgi:hypothetical protein
LESRGERNSFGWTLLGPKSLTKYRAPISLLLQVDDGNSSPAWQTPFQILGGSYAGPM